MKHEVGLVNKLKENLILAETSCMLDLGELKGETVTTLGLDQDDIKNISSSRPGHGPELGQQLLPLIEDVLFNKCVSLLCLLEPETDPHLSRSILHPQIQRLSDKVSDLVISHQLYHQVILFFHWSMHYNTDL